MKIDRIRVKNFQCIRDSGEIPIDDVITVLVGVNDSGKSAILKALHCFNDGETFIDEDVSTMAEEISRGIHTGKITKDQVEMVSIWVKFEDEDSRFLQELPPNFRSISTYQVVKMLDNTYHVRTGDGDPLEEVPRAATKTKHEYLIRLVEELQRNIANVYCGRVKRMGPFFSYTFLEQRVNEPDSQNLILFAEDAREVWDRLQEGDWVQVTKIGVDPYGRNRPARNAGLKIDLEPALLALREIAKSKPNQLRHELELFKAKLSDVPAGHPLRDYLSGETVSFLESAMKGVAEDTVEADEGAVADIIRRHVPQFVYLPEIDRVADKAAAAFLSAQKIEKGEAKKGEALLATLLKAARFDPVQFIGMRQALQSKYRSDASGIISERLRRHWTGADLAVVFDVGRIEGEEHVTINVKAFDTEEPPSRRSHGLQSYLSLFATLTRFALAENVVLLVDEPAVSLHPVAQKKVLGLLEDQPYQIVLATHLPFMIDHNHLDRVRVVKRRPSGSLVERDWQQAQEDLLPVWGALFGNVRGRYWLLVEGKDDRGIYLIVNSTCRARAWPAASG